MNRKRKIVLFAVLPILILILLPLIVWISGLILLSRSESALRKAGRPMRAEEIIPPEVSLEDNAAPLYHEAYTLLTASASTSTLSFVRDHWGKETLGVFATNSSPASRRNILEDPNAVEAFGLIKRGSAKSACRHQVDYAATPLAPLTHLSELSELNRFLDVKAKCEVLAGKREEAWDSVVTALRFADALRDEPILTSQLVRIVDIWFALNAIAVASQLGIPAGRDEEVMTFVAEYDNTTPLARALDGERVMGGAWVYRQHPATLFGIHNRSFYPSPPPGNSWDTLELGMYYALCNIWRPLMPHDHAYFNRVLQEHAERASEPFVPGDEQGKTTRVSVPSYCLFARGLSGSVGFAKFRHVQLVAYSHVVSAGLMVIRHKQDTGQWPRTLPDKAPGDPFTGKPLHYRTNGDGFLIYSVDWDLKDNGGRLSDLLFAPDGRDNGWSFPGFLAVTNVPSATDTDSRGDTKAK